MPVDARRRRSHPDREPLTRERVLEAALAVVDAEGVEALTMRRVATDVGFDPMALYRHVEGKDALLDGVVEMLWRQLPAARRGEGWQPALRAFAESLRSALAAHPGAARLLPTRAVFPRPALEQYAALLDELRAAGFDEPAAVRLVRAVSSIVFGDAFAAMTVEPMLGPGADSRRPSEEDVWILISQALPADTPPELVRVAHAICAADYGPTFDEALDLLLEGAMERRHAR